jgi:hypothetical protein
LAASLLEPYDHDEASLRESRSRIPPRSWLTLEERENVTLTRNHLPRNNSGNDNGSGSGTHKDKDNNNNEKDDTVATIDNSGSKPNAMQAAQHEASRQVPSSI